MLLLLLYPPLPALLSGIIILAICVGLVYPLLLLVVFLGRLLVISPSLVWVDILARRYNSHIRLARLYPLDLLISFTLMYGALLPLFQKGVIITM
jgi:hypothetical protein